MKINESCAQGKRNLLKIQRFLKINPIDPVFCGKFALAAPAETPNNPENYLNSTN